MTWHVCIYRSFEEEGKARMGVVECTNHNLLEPFHVLYEKEGKIIYIFVYYCLKTKCNSNMMNYFFPRQRSIVVLC